MKCIRRLVVSLDGTWNNRDDSTNVLYSHSLAFECHEMECDYGTGSGGEKIRATQERYYQEGVGTGPLDRITGGGFGFGIDVHVRKAYNWLVQNFEDGDGADHPPDEIYIFGFSRGAYTARSLVGFISMCGLLRRGAPLTVSQLWENYCILGLAREERRGGLMAKVFGKPIPKFRRMTDLTFDPWNRRAGPPVEAGELPKIREGIELNPTEDMLVRWSRRVKITYLGVYDTVGAVGWDALAIPGLRSKLAVQHNMRPSTIIQKCRHALAADEHRSSFAHTPFVAYIGAQTNAQEAERSENGEEADTKDEAISATEWDRVKAMWNRKIEQRWFVGAHSNIGGGYADNRLAQRPLEWILEGAKEARGENRGLICEKIPTPEHLSPAKTNVRDSFAEFAAPLWVMILRAKRNYRVIRPLPELRANRDEAKKKNLAEIKAGFSLISINEYVDESVVRYWQDSPTIPPNLIECASRSGLPALAAKSAENVWPGVSFASQFALVLWATLAAAGLAVANCLFCIWPAFPPVCFLCLVAFIFPFVDWAESSTNLFLARRGMKPWMRSLLDSIYWARSLGVVLFILGLVGGILNVWNVGWHTGSFGDAGETALELWQRWGVVAFGAAVGVLIGNVLNTSFRGIAVGAALTGLGTILLTIGLMVIAAHILGHVNAAASDRVQTSVVIVDTSDPVRMAGLLLLLQLMFVCFARVFLWVGEPMSKANLGTITRLQWNLKPTSAKACLDRWCAMLGDHADENVSECAMIAIVRQALWRDSFGFIPVYSGLLFFGLWFGSAQLGWAKRWAPMEHLWFVIPLVALLADYLENLCHVHYLSRHQMGEKPFALVTGFAFVMTTLKTIAFLAGIATVILCILCASENIAWSPKIYGMRGLTALLLTTLTLAGITSLSLWGIAYRIWNYLESKKLSATQPG